MVSVEELANKLAALRKAGVTAHALSVHDEQTISELKKILAKVAEDKSV
jgi:lambda repressor-like predicted transcriptional regulator